MRLGPGSRVTVVEKTPDMSTGTATPLMVYCGSRGGATNQGDYRVRHEALVFRLGNDKEEGLRWKEKRHDR